VEKGPPLWPLIGEQTEQLSANIQNDARAEIKARGFWVGGNGSAHTFFDVRVFHPNGPRAIGLVSEPLS